MSDFSFWASCLLDGVANGFIYGLLALSLVIMYRANKIFNFSQNVTAAFVIILITASLGALNKYLMVAAIVIAGLGMGMLLHLVVMRQITENRRSTHFSETLAVLGLLAVFDGFSNFVFGDTPRAFPSLFPDGEWTVFGFGFSYNSLGIIACSLSVVACIGMFFRFSKYGLLMEAVSENVVAARLRGIKASNILAMAWGITGAVSTFSAALIAPTVFVSPNMLTPAFAYSLVAVVIGGLESAIGAVIGGIAVGVVENLAANIEFLGSEMKFTVVFILLITTLMVRPRGIFGTADIRRV